MPERIDAREARAAVHGMLIMQAVGEIHRQTENGNERIKNLMGAVERTRLEAARRAPREDREASQLACEYFRELSLKFIGALPHHGMN